MELTRNLSLLNWASLSAEVFNLPFFLLPYELQWCVLYKFLFLCSFICEVFCFDLDDHLCCFLWIYVFSAWFLRLWLWLGLMWRTLLTSLLKLQLVGVLWFMPLFLNNREWNKARNGMCLVKLFIFFLFRLFFNLGGKLEISIPFLLTTLRLKSVQTTVYREVLAVIASKYHVKTKFAVLGGCS